MSRMKGSLEKSETHKKQQLAIDPQHSHLKAHLRMKIIALVIIAHLFGLALAESEEIPHNVTPLDKCPGIYYEQLPNLRVFNAKLKLRIYRYVGNFKLQLETLEKLKEYHPEICSGDTSLPCPFSFIDSIKEAFTKQLHYLESFKAGNVGKHVIQPKGDDTFSYLFECRWDALDNLITVTEVLFKESEGMNYSDVRLLKESLLNLEGSSTAELLPEEKELYNNKARLQGAVKQYVQELNDFVDAIDHARYGTFHRIMIPLNNISSCIKEIQPSNQLLQRFQNQLKDFFTEEDMIRFWKADVAYINSTVIYTITIPLLDNDKGLLLNDIIRQAIEFNIRLSPVVDHLWLLTSFACVVIFFVSLVLLWTILRIKELKELLKGWGSKFRKTRK